LRHGCVCLRLVAFVRSRLRSFALSLVCVHFTRLRFTAFTFLFALRSLRLIFHVAVVAARYVTFVWLLIPMIPTRLVVVPWLSTVVYVVTVVGFVGTFAFAFFVCCVYLHARLFTFALPHVFVCAHCGVLFLRFAFDLFIYGWLIPGYTRLRSRLLPTHTVVGYGLPFTDYG